MDFILLAVKVGITLQLILGLASFCTWFERKGSALIQDRVGANRAGAYLTTDNIFLKPVFSLLRIFGWLGIINTLVCDALKALSKEDFLPKGVSQWFHCLGPFCSVLPVFLAFALVPLAPDFTVFGKTIRAQVSSIDAGLLFILAMGSVTVYGVIIAGWTSNSKFALLGSLRAAAQIISYELAMGITFVAVILNYGSLDLYEIVTAQVNGWWGIFQNPLSFLILLVVGMAETKRGPFDLPESESELVAGYFTEYSGMKFLLFWLGEFAEIALFALLLVVLFFGGWDIPFIELPLGTWWTALIGHVVLMLKVLFFCMLQIVIRWTLPRFRYDQLMNLGWKILLPLSMVNLLIVALLVLV
jgi:NADH-quinone oxidoreductase subunit H